MKQARSEIEKASKCANKIEKEFLEAQPSLRKGSYGNSVEEWAEARLFEYWLLWVSDSEKKRVPFLLHDEIRKEIEMTEDEYLGGLIDLTGEIGRWAVARAAQRDSDSVERALASCRKIQEAVLALGGAAPYRVRKKMSDLERNAEKMQKILYVVFEREAREFLNRFTLSFVSEEYHSKKSMLEYKFDCDVNSNTNARTQIRTRIGTCIWKTHDGS